MKEKFSALMYRACTAGIIGEKYAAVIYRSVTAG
jgi:hypothetical protein